MPAIHASEYLENLRRADFNPFDPSLLSQERTVSLGLLFRLLFARYRGRI